MWKVYKIVLVKYRIYDNYEHQQLKMNNAFVFSDFKEIYLILFKIQTMDKNKRCKGRR